MIFIDKRVEGKDKVVEWYFEKGITFRDIFLLIEEIESFTGSKKDYWNKLSLPMYPNTKNFQGNKYSMKFLATGDLIKEEEPFDYK